MDKRVSLKLENEFRRRLTEQGEHYAALEEHPRKRFTHNTWRSRCWLFHKVAGCPYQF
jgi:hypothetical protein